MTPPGVLQSWLPSRRRLLHEQQAIGRLDQCPADEPVTHGLSLAPAMMTRCTPTRPASSRPADDSASRSTVHSFPEGTKTAADAAAAIGVEVGQIVKSLVFTIDGDPVLALVSGANQLDEKKLAGRGRWARSASGPTPIRRARRPGIPIGGVPPFGHAGPLRVFVDPDLLDYDEVWAAAGTWNDVFPVEPNVLVTATNGCVADIKQPVAGCFPRRRSRSRMPHHVTRPSASTTMRLDIFEVPRTRSVNEIGTSTMRPPLRFTA